MADTIADISYEKTGDLKSFASIMPFMSTNKLNEYAYKAYSENGINAVRPLAPFVSTEVLNNMAREVLEKDGLAGLSPIIPFIDSIIVEDYITRCRKRSD